jgi:photosystem II stability/assembly factor-like uncharacterized protein
MVITFFTSITLAQPLQWKPIDGPYYGNAKCFFVDADTIYTSMDRGIYVSKDIGTTWKYLFTFDADAFFKFGPYLFVRYQQFLRSPDNGITWKPIGVPGSSLLRLGNYLFCGSYRSQDTGATWDQVNGGIIGEFENFVYGIPSGTDPHGLYRSNDLGITWHTVSGLDGRSIYALVHNSSTYFAATDRGVYRSYTHGSSWEFAGAPQNDSLLSSIYFRGNNLVGLSKKGNIYLSLNDGDSWSEPGSGLTASAMAVCGQNIFAGTTALGVLTLTDSGWKTVSLGMPSISSVVCDTGNLFLGTTDNGCFTTTTKREIEWNRISTELNPAGISALTTYHGNLFAAIQGGGIYRFDKTTYKWAKVAPYNAKTIYSTDSLIFVVEEVEHLFSSSDGGNSWNSHIVSTSGVNEVVKSDGLLFASTPKGVYISADNAATWTKSGMTQSVTKLCNFRNIVFTTVSDKQLYRTLDSGQTWALCGLSNKIIHSLSATTTSLFAATDSGVYRSNDSGRSWKAVGFQTDTIKIVYAFRDTLYVVTNSNHLFRAFSNLTGSVSQRSDNTTIRISPNPTSSKITVLSEMPLTMVELLTISGEEIISCAVSDSKQTNLDLSNIPTGSYLLVVRTRSETIIRKIVKL